MATAALAATMPAEGGASDNKARCRTMPPPWQPIADRPLDLIGPPVGSGSAPPCLH